jgi:hypothetical protein
MTPLVRTLVLAALALVLGAAGCGGSHPQATIRYMTDGPDETVTYDMAVYQLARNDKIQIFLFKRVAAPIGMADADFEYIFFELPETASYGWLKEDDVPVYRWIRHEGRNHVWVGNAGQASERLADDKTSLTFKFQVTLEPTAGTAGGAYILNGRIACKEDVVAAQGLVNRYGTWLMTILGKQPPKDVAPAKTKAPAKPKTPANMKGPSESVDTGKRVSPH